MYSMEYVVPATSFDISPVVAFIIAPSPKGDVIAKEPPVVPVTIALFVAPRQKLVRVKLGLSFVSIVIVTVNVAVHPFASVKVSVPEAV